MSCCLINIKVSLRNKLSGPIFFSINIIISLINEERKISDVGESGPEDAWLSTDCPGSGLYEQLLKKIVLVSFSFQTKVAKCNF